MQGLQGIIRKTVNDDLQVNIWEDPIMNKIIPSLLFNMTPPSDRKDTVVQSCETSSRPRTGTAAEPLTGGGGGAAGSDGSEDPAAVAEAVFRDLMCRATYANINSVVKPMLQYVSCCVLEKSMFTA